MYRFFLNSLFLIVSTMAFSQNDDSAFIRRLSDEILSNGQAYTNLRSLTKSVGGRLAGSLQMVKAESWGVMALQQAGADTVWRQECLVPHWVRGGKDEALVSGSSGRSLSVLAIGNSLGTGPAGIEAAVVIVNSFDELENLKSAVKGKIVFFNYAFNPKYVETFRSYIDAVPYRGSAASRAARYGAIGVMIRSMTHSTDNYAHTGSLRYDTAYAKIPAVAIGLKDADWLAANLKNKSVTVRLKTNGHFLPDTTGHNIIGELRGSSRQEEIITVGAHLDSWDVAEGAHDDGAGIVHTIEILRAFRAIGYRPKHTIRFVLFANEENGVRGGNKYAEQAKFKGERHLFALESDAGGFTPRGFGFEATDEQFRNLTKWAPLLAPYGGERFVRGVDGVDIAPLHATMKVPTAGFIPDSQRYFDYHHAPNDVFENVNKRELELGAVNMAALIYLVDKYGL